MNNEWGCSLLQPLLSTPKAIFILLLFTFEVSAKQAAIVNEEDAVLCTEDLKNLGLVKLGREVRDFYESGADQEVTLRENEVAFTRWRFRPRVLVDVSHRQLSTALLGMYTSMPVGVSSVDMQKMAHPEGESATARACQAHGVPMIVSTLSTTALEDVRMSAPKAVLWFQLHVFKNRAITMSLVRRAEASGYGALVVTVGSPFYGNRFADARNKFKMPKGLMLANFRGSIFAHLNATERSSLTEYTNKFFDQSVTWRDVVWLKSITRLPIVLKGILTAEDAVIATHHGANAILVSNHGGRQLDGVQAAIEALPPIVAAVGGLIDVYLHGGVRTGADVAKAIALGARAVFVGRPAIWGLAYDGQKGVEKMLGIFREELNRTIALLGCPSVWTLGPTFVVRKELSAFHGV